MRSPTSIAPPGIDHGSLLLAAGGVRVVEVIDAPHAAAFIGLVVDHTPSKCPAKVSNTRRRRAAEVQ
jgi:hypothetical protein